MIGIIDCGCGNIKSVEIALQRLGADIFRIRDSESIENIKALVLPGVGSFGYFVKRLIETGLYDYIIDYIRSGRPILGICLGMQVLFEESAESPGVKGLSVFRGKCDRYTQGKVPQVGWNRIRDRSGFDGYAYFVNSYYVVPEDPGIVCQTSEYFIEFTSGIKKDNITAYQYHPEKSGKYGLEMIRRWINAL